MPLTGEPPRLAPMLPRPVRARRVWRETHDVVSVEVGAAMEYRPGQFDMLYVPGIGEVPISISGHSAAAGSIVHTLRDVGPVTAALARLRTGDEIGLRGPFGSAWPLGQASGRDVVVMAGGLGLAPLRPAIEEILARRQEYGRVAILYGTRSPADILFRRDLARWRRRLDVEVAISVDRGDDAWRGPVGVVTSLLGSFTGDARQALALVCGPEVMMRFCAGALKKLGFASGKVFLSLERNMKCAVGFCGHCQLGPAFVCKDGPVFSWERAAPWLGVRAL